jgi:hypothetical protein
MKELVLPALARGATNWELAITPFVIFHSDWASLPKDSSPSLY